MSRLVDYYVERLHELAAQLDYEEAALRELQDELPNLTSAMDWSLSAGRAEDLVDALYKVWVLLFDGDAIAGVADWFARADAIVDSTKLDWLMGMVTFQTGEFEVSAERLSNALRRFTNEGDMEGIAKSQIFLGSFTDDPDEGIQMQELGLQYFEENNLAIGAYAARIFQSVNLVRAGDLEGALELRLQMVEESASAPFPELRAWTHWNVANVLFALNRSEEAVEHNGFVLEAATQTGSQELLASAGLLVAVAEAHQGRFEEATLINGACQQIWIRLGVVEWWEATALVEAAMTEARQELGDAEYERLLSQGGGMSLEELVDFLGV